MKVLVAVLVLSALVNAGLIAVIAVNPRATSSTSSGAATSSLPAPRPAPAVAPRTFAEIAASPTREELPGLIAQLRSAGYPPEIIDSLVRTLIGRIFADRERGLRNASIPSYWQGNPNGFGSRNVISPEQREALRALQQERTQLFKELLGTGVNGTNSYSIDVQRRMLGPFSDDQLERLQAIRTDYMELRQALLGATTIGTVRLPEDNEKLALLAKEEEADLRAVISPDEYFEYQLRTSNQANLLRFTLGAFKPTEAEFREIVRSILAQPSVATEDGNATMNQLRTAIDNLTGTLPPARLAELKIVADPSNMMIARVLARYDLPLQAAPEVVSIQRDIQQRAVQARSSAAGNPAQASTQLAELNREATDRLQKLLGDRGLAAYRENGGQWLQMLQAPVARPATP